MSRAGGMCLLDCGEQRLLGNAGGSCGYHRIGSEQVRWGCGGSSEHRLWILQWESSELGSRDLQSRETLRDYKGPFRFQPIPHLSDVETEAQGKKGIGQDSTVSSFQLPELMELSSGGR